MSIRVLLRCVYSIVLLVGTTLCWAQAWVNEGTEDYDTNALFYSLYKFNPPEKKIVVTVTARNVKDWYERNLGSLFGQKYSNYRVIYIDDCSTDGTTQLVEDFIKAQGQQQRVTLIKNQQWLSQMANHYTVSHMCDDDEIIVNVDCDDWLKHEHVLSLINKVYSINPAIWVTYGGSQFYPGGEIPTAFLTKEIIQTNTFRETCLSCWSWWHPRTYYAWIFKQIRLRDILLNSSFKQLAPSPDSAFMFPILEMSGHHTYRIPDVIYRWNLTNPLSQWVVSGEEKQRTLNRAIAQWQKYHPLAAPLPSPASVYTNRKADLIIFNVSRAVVGTYLIDIIRKTRGLHKVYVLCEHATASDKRFYFNLKRSFDQIEPVYTHNIKHTLLDILKNAQEYILFARSFNISAQQRNISACICELERTFAAGYYLGIGSKKERKSLIPEYAPLSTTLGAWQFKDGKAAGSHMFSLDWVLYRKHTILDKIHALSFSSYKGFEQAWYSLNNNNQLINRSVGLFTLE